MADKKPSSAVIQARNELATGNDEQQKAARKRLAALGVDPDEDSAKRKAPEGRSTRAKSTTAKTEE